MRLTREVMGWIVIGLALIAGGEWLVAALCLVIAIYRFDIYLLERERGT